MNSSFGIVFAGTLIVSGHDVTSFGRYAIVMGNRCATNLRPLSDLRKLVDA